MKVLVACEFSGIVRDAFIARGHDAWSCDLLPTEREGPHIQGDVLEILDDGWDLMIAHPPCTYLTNAGIAWFNEEKYGEKAKERKKLREDACNFVSYLADCAIAKIAIENPIGYLSNWWRKPNQIIEPYYFGDAFVKPVCLWLKNLPLLTYVKGDKPKPYCTHLRKPSKNFKGGEIKRRYWTDQVKGSHNRSRFFSGIANAMSEQWGEL